MTGTKRETADLTRYPDVAVVLIGLRINRPRGLFTFWRLTRLIRQELARQSEGLLRHERLIYAGFPPHFGMRLYWKDLESLLLWTNTSAHGQWRDGMDVQQLGVGFWHEIYFVRSGRDAVYFDMPDIGLKRLGKMRDAAKTVATASEDSQ